MLRNNIGSLLSACDDLEFAKTRARSSSTLTLSRNAERSVIQAWCDRSSLKSVYGKISSPFEGSNVSSNMMFGLKRFV